MYKQRITAFIIGVLLFAIFPVTTHQSKQTETAKFVLAAWDYPDEYGQGIEAVRVSENISGSWVSITPFDLTSGEATGLEVNESATGIKILVKCWLNNTIVEAVDFDDGKNYIRHSVVLYQIGHPFDIIFSQQNFTYSTGTDSLDPMFYYQYYVEMSFDIVGGLTYTAIVDYEIYHEIIVEEYRHDCSSVSGITYYGNSHLGDNDYGIGSNGSVAEIWILPDDAFAEGVWYKVDFTNIDNTANNVNITVRYRVEGATNMFYYRLLYDDVSQDTSTTGHSTSWNTLNMTADANKTLDYIYLFNYDNPSSTASGNLSVWIDYISIYRVFSPDWNEVSEIEFSFVADIHPWGYNTALILLGLIMIPVSTIYLVKGGRDEFSDTKLFWFILIFAVGCGLFIGGVMP